MRTSYAIALSSILFIGLSISQSHAEEGTPAMRFTSDSQESEAALRNERTNPCAGVPGGDALRRCVIDTNRMGIATASRRTELLKRRSSGGRRLAGLLKRMERKMSDLDSPTNPGMRIDLAERFLQRGTLIQERAATFKATPDSPLFRVRTRTADRKTGGEIPVCSRRDGLRLIYCMQELGIEISPETVDSETWKIYERLYIR